MVGAMSVFLKRKEPATRTLAPASTQIRAVSSLIPPSTEMASSFPLFFAHSETKEILGTQSEMKDCPPNPGWTVMMRTRSA